MVNELIEAKNNNELNRVTQRWTRYELIVIDEMAYGDAREAPPGRSGRDGRLALYDRPQPTTKNYDQLLENYPASGVINGQNPLGDRTKNKPIAWILKRR
jgi:hypothetical protein